MSAIHKSEIDRANNPAAAWHQHSGVLAAWADRLLVNRRDVFGRYLAPEHRSDPDRTAFTEKSNLTLATLQRHFNGRSTGDLIGLHSTVRDAVTGDGEVAACWSRWLAIDIDRHDESTDAEATERAAVKLAERATSLGFVVLLLDSNGRGGFHLLIVFNGPVATAKVHALGKWLARDWSKLGLPAEPEVFPKQPGIQVGGFGNWLRLPGRHHTHDHHTRVWHESAWLEGTAAIKAIIRVEGNPADLIPAEALSRPKPKRRAKSEPKPEDVGKDVALASEALRYLDPSMPYREWLNVGMALTQLGREGLDLWDSWSADSEKYQEGLCDRKWRSFRRDGIALGSLFRLAKARGYEFPQAKARSVPTKTPVLRVAVADDQAAVVDHHPGDVEGRSATTRSTLPAIITSPTLAVAVVPPSDRTADDRDQPPPRFNLTDLGNAERLVYRHGMDLRYCHAWKRWLVWDGRRWALDQRARARQKARETVRSIYSEATLEDDPGIRKAIAKHAMDSEKRDKISGMLSLAEAEEYIPVVTEELDADPWVFNARNGTIDLRTGELRPHRRADLLTKMSPVDYDPDATCQLWDGTLNLFFAGDQSLIDYFQAICGYALAGVIRDHIMPVAYGDGSNGKSTMFGTLLEVFGPDYAMKSPPDMLMLKGRDSHPTDRADLFGKRLVVAIETEEGKRLNETMVKELTGGDKIRARRMREDFWEFHPTHTILLATNHKPVIKNTDNGIWRRLRLLPFDVKVEGEADDKTMPERLKAEYPGILAWCVRGCIRWQALGLGEPERVTKASQDYRKQQDTLGNFFAECCIINEKLQVRTAVIIKRYKDWCDANNEPPISGKAFGMAMEQRGFGKAESSGKWYTGIQVKAMTQTDSDRHDRESVEDRI